MQPLNKRLILFHLKEAKEQIDAIIQSLENDPTYEEKFSIGLDFEHAYHHLNTSWNSRYAPEDEVETIPIFNTRRQFPNDITFDIVPEDDLK